MRRSKAFDYNANYKISLIQDNSIIAAGAELMLSENAQVHVQHLL